MKSCVCSYYTTIGLLYCVCWLLCENISGYYFFMVLDIINVSIKDDASIYVVQSSSTTNNNDIMLFIICFIEYIVSIV
jgi:hypothetical protein